MYLLCICLKYIQKNAHTLHTSNVSVNRNVKYEIVRKQEVRKSYSEIHSCVKYFVLKWNIPKNSVRFT